jgi:DNA-directed RNA polymerase specialized sigma24 family protein
MTVSVLDTERERELLSQAIVRTLDSWPQLHRRIFAEAHYRGESAESIAKSLGVGLDTVRTILRDCDSRLRNALKSFREDTLDSLPFSPKYAVNRCCF